MSGNAAPDPMALLPAGYQVQQPPAPAAPNPMSLLPAGYSVQQPAAAGPQQYPVVAPHATPAATPGNVDTTNLSPQDYAAFMSGQQPGAPQGGAPQQVAQQQPPPVVPGAGPAPAAAPQGLPPGPTFQGLAPSTPTPGGLPPDPAWQQLGIPPVNTSAPPPATPPQADPGPEASQFAVNSPQRGAEDVLYSALSGVPGIPQAGAAVDAALGHLLGFGSQADSFGQRYQENMANEQARLQQVAPALRIPAEVGGNVLAALGTGGVATLAGRGLAAAVPAAAPTLNALSQLPQMAKFAIGGTLQGGVSGASNAPTNADILPDAALGAGSGLLAAPLLPALGASVATAGRSIGNYLSPFVGSVGALVDEAGNALLGSNGEVLQATPKQALLAGKQLVNAAQDPAAAQQALAGGSNQIVPGSNPTTFQQTGDMGLGALERGVATRNPAAFNDLRSQQNSARLQSLQGLRGNGDVMAVPNLVRAHMNAIDHTTSQMEAEAATQTQQAARLGEAPVAGARARADAAGASLGGNGTPEAAGNALREPVASARASAKTAENRLWRAVDPDGKLGMDVTPIRNEARSILKSITPSAAPLSGSEGQILNVAAGYKPLTAFRDVGDLRQNLNAAMKDELRARGRTPTYARLSRFKATLEGAIDSAVERRAAREALEVQQGTRRPEDTMEARLQQEANEFVSRQREQETAGQGSGNPEWDDPTGRLGGVPGVGGDQGAGAFGSGNGGGDTGLATKPSAVKAAVLNNFEGSDADALRLASAATRDRATRFDSGPVGQILRPDTSAGSYRASAASVPSLILRPGPTGREALDAYANAGGDMGAARDALAMQARKAAIQPDGSLKPDALFRFRQTYARALSHPAMAQLNQSLQTAEGAERAVADATSAARDQVDQVQRDAAARILAQRQVGRDFRASVPGKFIGTGGPEDVTRTIGGMFGTTNTTAQFKALAEAMKGDSDAIAGARRAIVQHIESRYIGNTEAGTSDLPGMKADQFQSFMKNNHAALSQFFSPNEVRTMGDLALDLRRSARSLNAVRIPGQSNTAQDLHAAGNEATSKFRTLWSVAHALTSSGLGAGVGGALGGFPGAALGLGAAQIGGFLTALRTAGIKNVEDLVTQAMLHPEVARVLMAKVTPETTSRVLRGLQHAITRSAAVNLGVQAQN